MLERKWQILENSEREAARRHRWRARGAFFHQEDNRYLRYLVPTGMRVLELGCGTGDTLAGLQPAHGVGVDFSRSMIEIARRKHPNLEFHTGDIEDPEFMRSLRGPFDFILIIDTIGLLDDCQSFLERLHPLCERHTRLVVAYYSQLWHPALRMAEWIGLRMPQPPHNVMSPDDIAAVAHLADFDPVWQTRRLLSPLRLMGLGRVINRFLSPWPIIRQLSLRHYVVCRSRRLVKPVVQSATIVIPARNERGNIEPAVRRIPHFCADIELIFVEGHSSDGTLEEIKRIQREWPNRNIKLIRQPGSGKGDAVRTAFDQAKGDILMILDADLTMPPEQLPKFWEAITCGKGEFINGSRLIYPMQDGSMQFLNLIANRLFSYAFTWLLDQRFTDTLCGTKVLLRRDYLRLRREREYFGDFDPFGDFELIFGATKLGLKCLEIPIRYESRSYGTTQISRFRHGWLLLKMTWFAFLRIKAL